MKLDVLRNLDLNFTQISDNQQQLASIDMQVTSSLNNQLLDLKESNYIEWHQLLDLKYFK